MGLKQAIVDRIIAEVESAWGVPIKLVKAMETTGAGGQADTIRGVVEVEAGEKWRSRSQLMSTLIHEVAHILCSRNKVWNAFHNYPHPSYLTEKQILAVLSTAWKAECYVEKMAKRMMAELYPGYLFIIGYGRRKIDKTWFDKEFLGLYRKELRKKRLQRIDKEKRLERAEQ
jgi:hypothetical protein